MARRTRLLALASAALALAACDSTVRPIDGGGDTASAECTSCHGDATRAGDALVRAAPPASPLGGDGGAHLAHLAGGTFRAPLACAECHYVPTVRNHADGNVTVPMAGLASTAPASPTFDPASGTCSGVYCHGATLGGGPAATPAWSSASGLGCLSCHGLPPPAPHPAGASCGGCHAGYTVSSVNLATHIDGMVQSSGGHAAGYADPAVHGAEANRVGLATCQACHGTDLGGGTSGQSCNECHGGTTAWRSNCTFCHGTPGGSSAPPVDTQGRTTTANVSVGAHAAHVTSELVAITCADCHPARSGDVLAQPAHVDGDARAEVAFSARSGGAGVVYARESNTSATCASTYCHGSAAVQWTDTADLGCASCHGVPPPSPHSSSTDCGSCHSGYSSTTVNATTHLDGTVQASSPHPTGYDASTQHGYAVNAGGLASCKSCHGDALTSCNTCHGGTAWQTNCTFCHGTSPGGPASPPVDTQGRTATTFKSVGAHASHVVTTTWMTPLACTQCHPDRTGSNVTTDDAHIDGNGVAEVVFGTGALARSGGAAATYATATGQCSSTYCHGQFTGGSGADPTWASQTAATCTTCHGRPPGTGRHGDHSGRSCGDCHGVGYTTSAVVATTHVDGSVQIGNRITSYNRTTGNCTSTCHGSETW